MHFGGKASLCLRWTLVVLLLAPPSAYSAKSTAPIDKEMLALDRLAEFAEVELTSKNEDPADVAKEVDAALAAPELDLRNASSLSVRTAIAGHNRQLYRELTKMMTRLQFPGDQQNWRVTLTASPNPTAGVLVVQAQTPSGTVRIATDVLLTFGLLAMTRTADELAAVIAHQMTHANLGQNIHLEGDRNIDEVLSQLADYRNLQGNQREEIRADVGAVERLIRGGYNPWAYYDVIRKMAKFERSVNRLAFRKLLASMFKGKKSPFEHAHPLGEIRGTAIKAYIAQRGYHKDLSELTKKRESFSPTMHLLRARAQVFSVPFNSVWTERAFKGGAVLAAGWAFGLHRPSTWGKIWDFTSNIAKNGWSSTEGARNTTWDGIDWAFSKVGDFFRKLGEYWPESPPEPVRHSPPPSTPSGPWLPDVTAWLPADFSMWDLTSTAVRWAIYIGVPYVSYRIAKHMYKSVYHNGPSENQLRDLKRDIVQNKKLLRDHLAKTRKQKSTPDPKELITLITRNADLLHLINRFYYHDSLPKRWHWISGLDLTMDRTIALHGGLLETFNKSIEGLLESEKLQLRGELQGHGMPAHALQQKPVWEGYKTALNIAAPHLADLQTRAWARSITDQVQLLQLAEELRESGKPADIIALAERLHRTELYDTAAELLENHGSRIIEYVFSKDNTNPELPRDVASLLTNLKHRALSLGGGVGNPKLVKRLLAKAKQNAAKGDAADRLAYIALQRMVDRYDSSKEIKHGESIEIRNLLTSKASSVSQLKHYLETEVQPRNVILEGLSYELHELIQLKPGLIRSEADANALLEAEYFWPKYSSSREYTGTLDTALVKSLSNFRSRFPKAWSFEPGLSEKLHQLIFKRLNELGAMPLSPEEKFELWKKMANRGVTSATDQLFEEIYEKADATLRGELAKAVDEGYVWDDVLRGRISADFLRAHPFYKDLMVERNPARRKDMLDKVIKVIEKLYPERGLPFEAELERLSWDINSNEEESTLISNAKWAGVGGEKQEDFGLRTLSAALEKASGWKRRDQWELIQFLRGDFPAPTKRIEDAFKGAGPERVRRIFQRLPVIARATLLIPFLDAQTGLLSTLDPKKGWAKTIISHVLSQGAPEARQIGQEVLEAFLHSLKATGNTPMQSYVLSYILAMPQGGKNAAGETLKTVLEIFGGTGIKIGQFLAASEVLPDEETRILRGLQEAAREPQRESVYADLRTILGDKKPPVELEELKGAASLKYAIKATDTFGVPIILKVMRQESVAHTKSEFNQLEAMADYLRQTYGAKYGVFRSIVRASREAVERELSLRDEAAKSKAMREKVYAGTSEPGIDVVVPEEVLMAPRLLAAKYARGTSLFAAQDSVKKRAASKILRMEAENLFSDQDVILFDPDRHPGNYRIDNDASGKITIGPIDFGQVLTITRAERENVYRLFAVASIAAKSGANQWAAETIGEILSLDAGQVAKLKGSLRHYFPMKTHSEVTPYFSLLAAIEDAGHKLPIPYFDFVRGVIQLKQIETIVGPHHAHPTERLAQEVRQKADVMMPQLRLTTMEKFRYGCTNGFSKVAAKDQNEALAP